MASSLQNCHYVIIYEQYGPTLREALTLLPRGAVAAHIPDLALQVIHGTECELFVFCCLLRFISRVFRLAHTRLRPYPVNIIPHCVPLQISATLDWLSILPRWYILF
jgi:hypothetical protein